MEAQRKEAVGDSGGQLAGYEAFCNIFPPPYGGWNYSCLGSRHRQNGDRICSTFTEWASGHTTAIRRLSIFSDGKIQAIASCSFGYADTNAQCPGTGEGRQTSAEHWDMTAITGSDNSLPEPGKLWKYDPDIDLSDDDGQWMRDCLTAPVFPPLDQRGGTPVEKTKQ